MQHVETLAVSGRPVVGRRQVLSVGLVILVIAYLIHPYVTLYRLDRALENRDAAVVAELIDWSAVREQLKADVTNSLASQASRANGPAIVGAAALALALSPYLFDPLAERVISPSGLIAWYSEARSSGRSSTLWEALSYAFFRTPTRFAFTLRTSDPQFPSLAFEMRLEGITWRVTRLMLKRAPSLSPTGSGTE